MRTVMHSAGASARRGWRIAASAVVAAYASQACGSSEYEELDPWAAEEQVSSGGEAFDDAATDLRAWADADREDVLRVLVRLRSVSATPEHFDALEREGQLTIPDVFARALALDELMDGNAGAEQLDGDAHVRIDQMMMFKLKDVGIIAARKLLARWDPEGASDDGALGSLAVQMTEGLLAWVIAHEVCHHALQHTASLPATLEEAKGRELAADACAFEHSLHAGYSMAFQREALRHFADMEELRAKHGLVQDEGLLRHPRFRARVQVLQQLMDTSAPVDGPWLTYSGYLRRGAIGALATVLIRSDRERREAFLILQDAAAASLLVGATERVGRGARVYLLPPGSAMLRILDTNAHEGSVVFADSSGERSFEVFRDSLERPSSARNSEIYESLHFDIVAEQQRALTAVAPGSDGASKVITDTTRGLQDALLKFAKQAMSAEEHDGLRAQWAAWSTSKLRAQLGDDGYARYVQLLQQSISKLVSK